MRILQLIDSLEIGGGERMAVNIANYFSKSGVPNRLVVSRNKGPLVDLIQDQENVVQLYKRSFLDLKAFFNLIQIIRNFQPTHIHAHDSSIFWAAIAGIFFPQMKVIWHAHYGGLAGKDSRFGKFLPLVKNKIDGLIAVNPELISWSNSSLPNLKARKFIENFPSIPSFSRSKPKEPKIICLANLKPPKNHKLLIRSFAKFGKRFPEYQLELIGSLQNLSYLEDLKKEISLLQIDHKINFHGEQVNISPFLESAEFAVLASDVEGLPVSILELGLAEIPIVCSNVGYCGELLEYGDLGYLFPPGEEEKLVQCMEVLVLNKEEAKTKASYFRKKVQSQYGDEQFGKKYRTFIQELN